MKRSRTQDHGETARSHRRPSGSNALSELLTTLQREWVESQRPPEEPRPERPTNVVPQVVSRCVCTDDDLCGYHQALRRDDADRVELLRQGVGRQPQSRHGDVPRPENGRRRGLLVLGPPTRLRPPGRSPAS